ncbi:MAG TPA: alpha/beta hydrolase family protein [Thermoanaerobaculia bacterium]|nr:alpha/beta hydrolase family protein [Thermoanaerobaculia bacterium]
MIRVRASGLVMLIAAACSSAPAGVRRETVRTADLPSPNEVLVVTPPSYDASPDRRYPVLYFLHDGYGDGRTLERRGVAAEALRRMREGSLPEFLIVAPDGPGTWFSDSHDGKVRFEQFLTVDLPRTIEARYRVRLGPGSRGITGISMGGYGAIKTALKHPNLYGSVSALSGAIIPFGWNELPRYSFVARWTLKRTFGGTKDDNSLDANDAWLMLWGLCFDAPPFSVELRAGTEDSYGLDRVAAQYGMLLNERGVPTTVVLEPGGHDWSYWRPAMQELLDWHAARFEEKYDPR